MRAVSAKRAHFAHGSGKNDAVAGEDDRVFGAVDQRERFVDLRLTGEKIGDLAMGLGRGRLPVENTRFFLCVFGDVHEHWTGAVGGRDMKSLAKARGDILGPGDQIIVLGDGQGDAGDVGFLEGVGADHRAAHLARDADDGRGVHHGRGNAGNHVGGAGAGSCQSDTHAAAGARVSIGHVRGALLVAHQHMVHARFGHGVVGGQDGAAGVSEYAGTPSRSRHSQTISAPESISGDLPALE